MLSTDGLQESSNLCFIIYKLYRKNLINSDKMEKVISTRVYLH